MAEPEYTVGEPVIRIPEDLEQFIVGALFALTKEIYARASYSGAAGLGGPHGYGAHMETEAFLMHPFCWCEREDACPWCSGQAPNFLHKPSGLGVSWHKYIGRGMDFDLEKPDQSLLNLDEVIAIMAECTASLPAKIREENGRFSAA